MIKGNLIYGNTLWLTVVLSAALILSGCNVSSQVDAAQPNTATAVVVKPTSTLTPTRLPSPSPAPSTPTAPLLSKEPSGTPSPQPTATVSSADKVALAPDPTILDIAWQNRSIFEPGLIKAEQKVLHQLPGATIYHIDLQISNDLQQLQGQQEVLYTNQEAEPLTDIYFRLFPNLAGGSTVVANLTVNSQPVEAIYELRDSALRVPLSSALQTGEQVIINMDYSVDVPSEQGGNYGTFTFLDDVLALAHFYPMIPVYDDEGWNTEIAPAIGDVVYADSSFYIVRVTAPASQVLVASGIEVDRTLKDDQQTLIFAAGPVRDFYLAASEDYRVISQTVGQTTINSYAPTDLADGSDLALKYAVNALKSFNQRFGPYPYTEFDMVSTTTFALGIEYPGIVALLDDIYQQGEAPLLESVVAHEVAHQWFYGVVGNDQIDEPWVDEALAQFATLLYFSDVYGASGADAFRGSLQRRWNRVGDEVIPIGLPVRDYTTKEYSAIVYGRGPLFIAALEKELGQERFDVFLQDYYQSHKWQTATGDSLRQLAEQHCNCDLSSLFETWVYELP